MESLEQILGGLRLFFEYELFSLGNGRMLKVGDLAAVLLAYVFVRIGLYFLVKALHRLLRSRAFNKQVDPGKKFVITKVVRYFVYVIFIVFALETLHFNVNVILASSAALLVGVGLGVQQVFSDLVSGVILLFEGSVVVGDIIEVNDGLVGQVEEIGLRTSKIKTRDNISIIVPNSRFIMDKVINWTHNQRDLRYRVSVGVAYGSDVPLVRRLLVESAAAHPKILANPAPFSRFVDFGNSSLDFELYFWSKERWLIEDVRSDLRAAIDDAFRAHEVTIPFPQRDLHLKSSEIGSLPSADERR